jgi:protein gp37
VAYRFKGPGQPYEGLAVLKNGHPSWTGEIRFVEEHLLDPLKWKDVAGDVRVDGEGLHVTSRRPRRIFVNSMSDLFHENVTDEMRDKIFAVMALCPQHTFQVLTKRPKRMLEYLHGAFGRIADIVVRMRAERGDKSCVGPLAHLPPGARWWPLANVWLGVSVENQETADERIPLLLETPAAVRFISAEPLLGSLWIAPWLGTECCHDGSYSEEDTNATICRECEEQGVLDWVICGGESGPGARPMHPDWARGLRDQCMAARVPFFFKQWGEYLPPMTDGGRDRDGAHVLNASDEFQRVGKHAAGSLLDGREWKQFPGGR